MGAIPVWVAGVLAGFIGGTGGCDGASSAKTGA